MMPIGRNGNEIKFRQIFRQMNEFFSRLDINDVNFRFIDIFNVQNVLVIVRF